MFNAVSIFLKVKNPKLMTTRGFKSLQVPKVEECLRKVMLLN